MALSKRRCLQRFEGDKASLAWSVKIERRRVECGSLAGRAVLQSSAGSPFGAKERRIGLMGFMVQCVWSKPSDKMRTQVWTAEDVKD